MPNDKLDAQRYRWLRWAYFSRIPGPEYEPESPQELDAAIDKAMLKYPVLREKLRPVRK